MKVDSIGLTYISGGGAAADPGRARSGETVAVRRDAAATRRQGEGRQPLVHGRDRCAMPARFAASSAGQTLAGIPDIGLLADFDAGRTSGLRARTWPASSSGPTRWSTASGTMRATARATWERVPAVSLALAKRAGANAVVVSEEIAQRLDGAEVAARSRTTSRSPSPATMARPRTKRPTNCCFTSASRRSRSSS